MPSEHTTRSTSHCAARALEPLLPEISAVAAGGALGASLRFALAEGMGAIGQHAALATTIANLTGAFLLGMLVTRLGTRDVHPLLRPFLVIGVFGSFTTFSALAFDNRALADHFGELAAALHIAASIVAGLLVFAAGRAAARARP